MSAESDLAAGLSPASLIPGDVETVESMAANCTIFADQLADTRKGIQYIELNGADWTGGAAEVYFAAKDSNVDALEKATEAFDTAAGALADYATAVHEARTTAAAAADDYKKAKQAESQCAPTPPTAPATVTPPLAAPTTSLFDTSNAGSTHGAVVKLLEARHHVELAGQKAATALDDAVSYAPIKLPPPADSGGGPGLDDVKDLFSGIGHLFKGTVEGLGTIGTSTSVTTKQTLSDLAMDEFDLANKEVTPALVTLLSTLLLFSGGRGAIGGSGAGRATSVAEKELLDKEFATIAEKNGMTVEELMTGTNGRAPNLRGQAGANYVANRASDAGYTVTGREVTVQVTVNGEMKDVRPDLFLRSPDGQEIAVDVKTGPKAHLQINQGPGYDAMRNSGFIPKGPNAAAAGLTPGEWHDPIPVWEVYVNR